LFAIRFENYQPFITNGLGGLAASLLLLFFSYAGFESLAQTAGEVEGSTERLPGVFLKGLIITAVIFVLMSVVAFGVLPGSRLQASNAPMAEVASVYLPVGAALFVTFGAIMAITTSINSTMLVPSRLAIILARDGLAPRWIGTIHPRTGTPIRGLTLTFLAAIFLLAFFDQYLLSQRLWSPDGRYLIATGRTAGDGLDPLPGPAGLFHCLRRHRAARTSRPSRIRPSRSSCSRRASGSLPDPTVSVEDVTAWVAGAG